MFAADHQRLDVIDQLIEAGTPVNEADAEWGRLPLHTAAGNGRAASVRRLLAHGADPNLRDPRHHRTPLEECQPRDSPGHREVEAILRPLAQNAARSHPSPPAPEPGHPGHGPEGRASAWAALRLGDHSGGSSAGRLSCRCTAGWPAPSCRMDTLAGAVALNAADEPEPGVARQGREVNDNEMAVALMADSHDLPQKARPVAVRLAGRILLAGEGDAGRDTIRAKPRVGDRPGHRTGGW